MIRAWIVMLLLGALHHDVSPSVPALGYWWCVLIVFVVALCAPSVGEAHGAGRVL